MNVRQFGLKNSESKADQMYDLMDIHHFYNVPEGLGWGLDSKVERVGETFIVTDSVIKQQSPSGKMWFTSYEEYEEFLRFIQVGGLILCYKPSESIEWRYLECSADIKKSEIDHDTNYLTCNITFTGLSRWYEAAKFSKTEESEIPENTKEFKINSLITQSPIGPISPINSGEISVIGGDEQQGSDSPVEESDENAEAEIYDHLAYKYYLNDEPDSFGDYYYYVYMTEANNIMYIENGSQLSYFRLSIIGPCTNPSYFLLENGRVTHSGKINTTIASGYRLVVDTNPKTLDIALYSANSERRYSSLYSLSDFTTDRIFALPRGRSTMYVLDDGGAEVEAYVEVKKVV